jgi:hypothetical protein
MYINIYIGTGRSDGGHGFLIVDEDEEEKKSLVYDEEREIVLTDWYHLSGPEIMGGLNRYSVGTNGFKWPGM